MIRIQLTLDMLRYLVFDGKKKLESLYVEYWMLGSEWQVYGLASSLIEDLKRRKFERGKPIYNEISLDNTNAFYKEHKNSKTFPACKYNKKHGLGFGRYVSENLKIQIRGVLNSRCEDENRNWILQVHAESFNSK